MSIWEKNELVFALNGITSSQIIYDEYAEYAKHSKIYREYGKINIWGKETKTEDSDE